MPEHFFWKPKCEGNYHTFFFFWFYLFIFRERGREGEREGEKHQCERQTSISCPSHMPQPETDPATQARALTRNPTGSLSLRQTTPNQLSHTSQGPNL